LIIYEAAAGYYKRAKENAMQHTNVSCVLKKLRVPFVFFLLLLVGCAGAKTQPPDMSGYVEVTNPSYTLNPSASPTMWVPREYVEKGPARGSEYVKRGYDSVMDTAKAPPAPPAARTAPVPVAPTAPTAPAPVERHEARKVPHFVQIVAVDGDKVYFNLGAEGNYVYGQELRVFKGKTINQELGLVPGDVIGVIEIRGYVGPKSGYGILKRGGPLSINDLVEVE
jgi:hypothetical protein